MVIAHPMKRNAWCDTVIPHREEHARLGIDPKTTRIR